MVWYDNQSREVRRELRKEVTYRFHKHRMLGDGPELCKAKVRDELSISAQLVMLILKKKKAEVNPLPIINDNNDIDFLFSHN